MAAPEADRSFSGVPGEEVREQPYCPQQLQRLAVADHVAAGAVRFIGLPAISQGEQTPYGVAVRAAESISDSRRGQNLGVLPVLLRFAVTLRVLLRATTDFAHRVFNGDREDRSPEARFADVEADVPAADQRVGPLSYESLWEERVASRRLLNTLLAAAGLSDTLEQFVLMELEPQPPGAASQKEHNDEIRAFLAETFGVDAIIETTPASRALESLRLGRDELTRKALAKQAAAERASSHAADRLPRPAIPTAPALPPAAAASDATTTATGRGRGRSRGRGAGLGPPAPLAE